MDGDENGQSRQARDFRDLQIEEGGLAPGRMNRFLPQGERPDIRGERKREDKFWDLVAAVEALTYEQRIDRLRDRFAEFDRASLEALREAERRVEQSERALDELRRRAAVDPAGRRMYRTQDGRTALYEDGTQVPGEIQRSTDWTGAPTFEEFSRQDGALAGARAGRDAIVEFREQLRERQTHLENGELSPDELADLENWTESAPDAVRARIHPAEPDRTSAARRHAPVDAFSDAPETTSAFNRAAPLRGQPDTTVAPGAAPASPRQTETLKP